MIHKKLPLILIGVACIQCVLYAATNSISFRLWREFKVDATSVLSIAFSHDGELLAVGDNSRIITMFDVKYGDNYRKKIHSTPVYSITFSHDSQTFFSADYKSIKKWNLKDSDITFVSNFNESHSNSIVDLDVSPDGKFLISASEDNSLKMWSTSSLELISTLISGTNPINCATISSNQTFIVAGSGSDGISVFDANSGAKLSSFKKIKGQIISVDFLANNNDYCLISTSDGKISSLNISNGKSKQILRHRAGIVNVAISPDGDLVAYRTIDNKIKFYSLTEKSDISSDLTVSGKSKAMAFNPSGQMLAFATGEGTVQLYRINTSGVEVSDTETDLRVIDSYFMDENQDYELTSTESGILKLTLRNEGIVAINDVRVWFRLYPPDAGMILPLPYIIKSILPNATEKFDLKIETNNLLQNGTSELVIYASDGLTEVYPPEIIHIRKRGFTPPKLRVKLDQKRKSYKPGDVVEVIANIINTGGSTAKDVIVAITPGVKDVTVSNENIILSAISPGSERTFTITLLTSTETVKAKYNISILGAGDLVFLEKEEHIIELHKPSEFMVDSKISLTSVDDNIPRTGRSISNGFAIIIGNEDYKHMDDIEYAEEDAHSINQYLVQTLGYSYENVDVRIDQTLSELKGIFGDEDQVKNSEVFKRAQWMPNERDIFIYYSGHGSPDKAREKGYLVPTDCDAGRIDTDAYPIDRLCDNLAMVPAKSITVVVDACFTKIKGAKGPGLIIVYEEDAKKFTEQSDRLLVMACGPDQQSYQYDNHKHGILTYVFLRFLQDNEFNGSVSGVDLENYLTNRVKNGVPRVASYLDKGSQMPQVLGDLTTKIFK